MLYTNPWHVCASTYSRGEVFHSLNVIEGCLFSWGKAWQSTFCEEGEYAAAVLEGSNEVLGNEYFNVD